MLLEDRSVQIWPRQDMVTRAGHNQQPWLDATAADDGAEPGSFGQIERLSICSTAVSEIVSTRRPIDAEMSATLSAALCRLSEHLGAASRQVFTMSPHEAEMLLSHVVESLISISRSLRPCRTPSSSRNQPIRIIVEKFIEARLSCPELSPLTIARDLEIPRSTLYKAFVDVGGIAKYIQDRRLIVAKSLLLRPEECRSLGQIASSLGFANCATFSKAFRKRFGQSPRSMRAFGADHAASLARQDRSPVGR